MKEDWEEFEDSLRGMTPARPSAALKARIAERIEADETASPEVVAFLPQEGPKRGRLIWGTTFTALVSAVAAVWAVLLVLDPQPRPSLTGETTLASSGSDPAASVVEGASEARFEVGARPIEQYSTLVGAAPSPVFYREDGEAMQRVALRYLETEVWELEEGGETFTVQKVRDEIRVIPAVSF
ncbi:hypothetical protein [Pelagicoccus albus]|uniref:Uncharacterized protein n=1 Tax=Pelagicoccus albus TaxID=415222 RepID=A0A7X1B842_9BACT|nr:hypothetical protein [Pelagicoccus albus]MBC2607433.1 hypothetical protein [Pelagicoccus albus]